MGKKQPSSKPVALRDRVDALVRDARAAGAEVVATVTTEDVPASQPFGYQGLGSPRPREVKHKATITVEWSER